MKKKAVIIPAAGSGVRLGSDIPKPFIDLFGKTILQRSIECFLGVEGLVYVVIATSPDNFEGCNRIFEEFEQPDISFNLVKGGAERQASIWNAMNTLPDDIELVAIHDAVRPFASLESIEECFDTASELGAAIVGVPVKDTIKKIDSNERIVETPDRSELWQAQTPQIFKKDIITEAYELAVKENFLGTDDASLVERIGVDIKMVEGDRKNLKITYPIDLRIAELIIKDGL